MSENIEEKWVNVEKNMKIVSENRFRMKVDSFQLFKTGNLPVPLEKIRKKKDFFVLVAEYGKTKKKIEHIEVDLLKHLFTTEGFIDILVTSSVDAVSFSLYLIQKNMLTTNTRHRIGTLVIEKLESFQFTRKIEITFAQMAKVVLGLEIYNPSVNCLKSTPSGQVGSISFVKQFFDQNGFLILLKRAVHDPATAFGNIREENRDEVTSWINKYEKYFTIINISRDSGYGICWAGGDAGRYGERTGCYIETTIWFRRNSLVFGNTEPTQMVQNMEEEENVKGEDTGESVY